MGGTTAKASVIEGGVPEVRIKILLRSFKTEELKEEAGVLKAIARTLEAEFTNNAAANKWLRYDYRPPLKSPA